MPIVTISNNLHRVEKSFFTAFLVIFKYPWVAEHREPLALVAKFLNKSVKDTVSVECLRIGHRPANDAA